MFLSFVEPSLVRRHLHGQVVAAGEIIELLEFRAIPAGTPVFLDEHTMRPIEPLCSWFRQLAYEDKDAKTLREYAYIARRFVHFLQSRDRDLLDCDRVGFLGVSRVMRTQLQDRPVGDATWAKEAQLLNQLYRWLVEHGHLRHRPLRMTRKGRNPLTPRLRRGMDIRHMTLAQYRYFRDVGLGDSCRIPRPTTGSGVERRSAAGPRPIWRCRTGMRPEEWSTVLLPELGIGQQPARRAVDVPGAGVREIRQVPRDLRAIRGGGRRGKLPADRTPGIGRGLGEVVGAQRQELFVVDHIDHDAGKLRGVLDGQRRTFTMSAMGPRPAADHCAGER